MKTLARQVITVFKLDQREAFFHVTSTDPVEMSLHIKQNHGKQHHEIFLADNYLPQTKLSPSFARPTCPQLLVSEQFHLLIL